MQPSYPLTADKSQKRDNYFVPSSDVIVTPYCSVSYDHSDARSFAFSFNRLLLSGSYLTSRNRGDRRQSDRTWGYAFYTTHLRVARSSPCFSYILSMIFPAISSWYLSPRWPYTQTPPPPPPPHLFLLWFLLLLCCCCCLFVCLSLSFFYSSFLPFILSIFLYSLYFFLSFMSVTIPTQ